jgi:hypothetical protein
MSQGNDFANYASSVEDGSSASEDVWFVAVSSDDIKQMTVDQLDEAFRLGVITAQTAVWTEGMEAWAPLGEVADLDSSEETSGEVEAVQGYAGGQSPSEPSFPGHDFAREFSEHEAAPAFSSSMDSVQSQRPANSGWNNPFEAPRSAAPAAREETLHSAVHNSIGPTSFAPVTSSYAPSAGGSLAHSTGPVALNVDEDMPPVHRGRRFRPERWLLAAAGVIAVGLIGFNNKDLFSASSSVAAVDKQASAAALIARPYELGADKADKAEKGASDSASSGASAPTTAPAAVKSAPVDDGDAPIGSLKGEKADDEESGEADAPAAAPVSKPGSTKDKDVRGSMAKAFAKGAPATKGAKAEKPVKASKAAKAKVARKPPSRAPGKSKKGVTRAASAFDPLNGSLP